MSTLINRYCGAIKVGLCFVRVNAEGRSEYKGKITVGEHVWRFDNLCSAVGGSNGDEVSEMARSAISFGSYYTSDNRSDDCPEWAPTPEVARAISDNVWYNDDCSEYVITKRSQLAKQAA